MAGLSLQTKAEPADNGCKWLDATQGFGQKPIKSFPRVMKLQHITVLFLICLTFGACAFSPEARLARAKTQLQAQPFEERPAFLDLLEKKGAITPESKLQLLSEWKAENKKREQDRVAAQKLWDSLTPAQKIDYTLRLKALQQQQEIFERQARMQNAAIGLGMLQNGQMLDAYRQRTQALSNTINVNVNSGGSQPFNYVIPR